MIIIMDKDNNNKNNIFKDWGYFIWIGVNRDFSTDHSSAKIQLFFDPMVYIEMPSKFDGPLHP